MAEGTPDDFAMVSLPGDIGLYSHQTAAFKSTMVDANSLFR